MWVASYECHEFDRLLYSATISTRSRWKALLWYEWWALCYLFTQYPVKSVGLHRVENGVTFIRGRQGKSQNADIMRRLKWEKLRNIS